jgi:hypothetical protein
MRDVGRGGRYNIGSPSMPRRPPRALPHR